MSVVTRKFWTTGLFSLLVVLTVGTGVFVMFCQQPIAGTAADKAKNRDAVRLMRQLSTGGQPADRVVEAGRALAKLENSDQWLVLVLTAPEDADASNYRILEDGSNLSGYFQPLGLISLLQELSGDVSPAVLWAVTYRLKDDTRSTYPEEEVVGFDWGSLSVRTARKTASTPPINEVARETLIRNLNVDHGFDEIEWRQEILNRVNSR